MSDVTKIKNSENAVIIEAWDGVLFEKFSRFKYIFLDGLAVHGTVALRRIKPAKGQRVIDIGCGFGDGTAEIAEFTGRAYGVDCSPNFIKYANEHYADKEGNVTFDIKDVQVDNLGGPYDLAFARFGTMFFSDATAALRNICNSLKPGGRMTMVVWRKKKDNGWLHEAEKIVRNFLEEPASDAPTCGPGPFSMADADDTSRWMQNAGFERVSLERHDIDMKIGKDSEEAMEFSLAIGPAGEVIRLSGEKAKSKLDAIKADVAKAIEPYKKDDGVWMPSSTWFVTGYRPE
ncbi:MAG: class I SAM-dependent methyltransferase [Patescibacteria group bacterium]